MSFKGFVGLLLFWLLYSTLIKPAVMREAWRSVGLEPPERNARRSAAARLPEGLRGEFEAGGVSCRPPRRGSAELSEGGACWCLKEIVRLDLREGYAANEANLAEVRRWMAGLERLCSAPGGAGLKDGWKILFPDGMRFLADALSQARIGNPSLVRTGPDPPSGGGGPRGDAMEAQSILALRGYAPGPADGRPGRRTAAAIAAFRGDLGLAPTGELDGETLALLRNSIMLPSFAPYRAGGG